jgi:hypothetical protein
MAGKWNELVSSRAQSIDLNHLLLFVCPSLFGLSKEVSITMENSLCISCSNLLRWDNVCVDMYPIWFAAPNSNLKFPIPAESIMICAPAMSKNFGTDLEGLRHSGLL